MTGASSSANATGPTVASDPVARILAAVGLPLGLVVVDDPDSIGPAVIATSGHLVELSPASFALWAGAREPRSTAELFTWARDLGVADPDPLLAELLKRGLVVSLPSGSELEQWSSHHRLIPQGTGIGNDAEADEVFVIGDRSGNQVLGVDIGTYYVWGLSGVTATLADALAAAVGSTDIPLDWLQNRVTDVLPELLRAQVAHLDRA